MLTVTVAAHDSRWGLTELVGGFGRLTVPRLDLPIGAPLRVRIRARDVILALTQPAGISALNVLAGKVDAMVPVAEGALEVQLRLGPERLLARVTRRSGEALGLEPGREVFALIKTVAIDRRNFGRDGETPIPVRKSKSSTAKSGCATPTGRYRRRSRGRGWPGVAFGRCWRES